MNIRTELVRAATRRLLLAIVALIVGSAGLLTFFVLVEKSVPLWIVVMAFGMSGGFISIQRRLKAMSDEDLELMAKSWSYTILSPLAGGVLATVLYALFVGELLKGDLFPCFGDGESTSKDFSRLLECTACGYKDYGKLIFWSFCAGFAESFVTNIVGSFTKNAGGA